MDALTAQSMAMSEKLGKELDAFLAAKGIAFDELNNDPDTIAELEKRLYTPLSNTLGAASCSGIFFGLPEELEAFKKRKYQYMAKDREGRDVFLADSGYVLQMAQMDFKNIKFHFTSEF